LRYSGVMGWNDTNGDMYFTRNFGIFLSDWNVQTDTVYIRAKLEGKMSNEPLRVRLKYNFNPDQPHLELVFRDDYVFKPNEYIAEFQIVIKRPPQTDRTFIAGVTFDFENSDLVAGGALNRQVFELRVSDTYTLENAGLVKEIWEDRIEPSLGAYSNVKLRFVAYALQRQLLTYLGSGVSAYDKQTIVNKLNEYNAAHPGNPLRDENGEIVSFEP